MMNVTIRRPYQTIFMIQTNCEKLVYLLRLQYGTYLCEDENEHDSIITAYKSGTMYQICFAGEQIKTDSPLHEIDNILFNNTRYDNRIFAIHGAALEWQGQAYLFPAATTSGKTTLASFLTSQGFGYITDDCILLDKTSHKVIPFGTPMHLRQGGLEVLRRYRTVPKNIIFLDDPVNQRYVYTPDNCTANVIPLGKIFFITRTDRDNRLVPMSTNEKIVELMKSPITHYSLTGEYIRFLSELVQKTDCCQLLYSDMAYVAEVILNG